MASFLVQTDDLQPLVKQWKELVQQHQQSAPGSFDYREAVFAHLQEPEFRRIQWFYYNDNENGVTIRLYDRAFFERYPGDFIDTDDCILRGKDLGKEQATLKVEMRRQFREIDQKILPGSDQRRGTRSDFFESPRYNNATQASSKNEGAEEKKEDSVNILGTVVELLNQFRQVILYGPPGTGKTRLARLTALAILNGTQEPQEENAVKKSLKSLKEEGKFDLVVFHPAYEYEQFVGGIAPRLGAGGLQYEVKEGPFFKLCRREGRKKEGAVLIIDEIN
jgi:hypothetical protein